MNWIDVIENRKQTFAWNENIPDKKIILEVLEQLHNYCPSKKDEVPYSITLLDFEDKELRHKIFKDTYCSSDVDDDRRNPQVLAPYLIGFAPRETDPPHDCDAILEIGMAAMFFTLSAASKGLDTGYCGCYHGDDYTILIGVGYAGEPRGLYFNPILKKYINAPGVNRGNKPNMEVYMNV